ncbi:EF-P lysine aminoacylase EpmA [Estrella lausannensis]|uniref:EF-P lysine aminoacylase EpmA n=1 Tax=Estrella lausannensis TaxID=483423 RepID=UPI001EF5B2CB|nr:EF-P lysine aminoacylase EpmA [Estrella lausannensis]
MSQASLAHKINVLKDRSLMLKRARSFFYERNLLEVDCPALSRGTSVDEHIDLIATDDGRHLFSSPEYGMKRLLASGSGDIFQLSHVYRAGEVGKKHQPEFMMAEWYRLGFTFSEMIEETLDFIRLFIGPTPAVYQTYRDLFQEMTGLDPFETDEKGLTQFLQKHSIDFPDDVKDDKDSLLNLIVALHIEPRLPHDELFVLTHYPGSQAALAKKVKDGKYDVAERFEVYHKGLELANGYHELSDPKEQRARLIESNRLRLERGKKTLPIDEHFLSALEQGLPDCCGVAVGFDRLMMLRHDIHKIDDVIALSFDETN